MEYAALKQVSLKSKGFSNTVHYLRCFAALLIVIFHTLEPVLESTPQLGPLLRMLRVGTDIFFVLGGFLIWRSVLKTTPLSSDFMLRRVSRLAPLYWLVTGVAVMLALIKPKLFWMIDTGLHHVIASLLFLPDYNHNHLLFPALLNGWMINSLMFLYILVALSLYLPAGYRLLCVTVFVGLASLTHPFFDGKIAVLDAYTSPLLLEFIGGAWTAQYMNSVDRDGMKNIPPIFIFSLLAVAFAGIYATSLLSQQMFWIYRFIVLGLPACLIVASAAIWDKYHPVIYIPFLKQISDASYSMYLIQFLILAPVIHLLRGGPVILTLVSALIIVTLTALLVYKYVEQPLSSWVERHIKSRKAKETLPHPG